MTTETPATTPDLDARLATLEARVNTLQQVLEILLDEEGTS